MYLCAQKGYQLRHPSASWRRDFSKRRTMALNKDNGQDLEQLVWNKSKQKKTAWTIKDVVLVHLFSTLLRPWYALPLGWSRLTGTHLHQVSEPFMLPKLPLSLRKPVRTKPRKHAACQFPRRILRAVQTAV